MVIAKWWAKYNEYFIGGIVCFWKGLKIYQSEAPRNKEVLVAKAIENNWLKDHQENGKMFVQQFNEDWVKKFLKLIADEKFCLHLTITILYLRSYVCWQW